MNDAKSANELRDEILGMIRSGNYSAEFLNGLLVKLGA